MNISRERIATMVARVFAGIGAEAVYTPAAGAPVDLRAIPRIVDVENLDAIGMPTVSKGRVMSLLTADVAARPTLGATIEVKPGTRALPGLYSVLGDALCVDAFQVVWRCRVSDPQ